MTSRPPPMKPSASSLAPKPAEPATMRLVSTSQIDTSQSPDDAVRRAATMPLPGAVARRWTTPAAPSEARCRQEPEAPEVRI